MIGKYKKEPKNGKESCFIRSPVLIFIYLAKGPTSPLSPIMVYRNGISSALRFRD